jgi:D-beta-D-heptose 7-phosphate kinase/D-beta-D-heptose 1-phosphate adenosyltransferase
MIVSRTKAKQIVDEQRMNNQVVVFTNGCFDILHRGHVEYLKSAKELGNFLVVGLNSNQSVKRLKGQNRPFFNEDDRAEVLDNLYPVDLITIFEEDTPLELIHELKPDILVKGGDYNINSVVGAKEVKTWGGIIKIIPFIEGYGTSKLVEKIVNESIT